MRRSKALDSSIDDPIEMLRQEEREARLRFMKRHIEELNPLPKPVDLSNDVDKWLFRAAWALGIICILLSSWMLWVVR